MSKKKKVAKKAVKKTVKKVTPPKPVAKTKPTVAKSNKAVVSKSRSRSVVAGAAVPKPAVDLERLLELDFVRTTEAAALNAYRWLGRGNAQAAHAAAVDAIRGTLDLSSVSGTVLFGDGTKPQPGGITPGEQLGNWGPGSLQMDLAMIPIDGLRLVEQGLWGAIAVLVAARSDDDMPALTPIASKYMEKIAFGPAVQEGPGRVHLNASVRDNLEIVAMKLGKRVQDLNVAVLDRKRHEKLVKDIRQAGASARLFTDGDIAGCMAACMPNTGVDVFMGTGGSTEAVLAAAAIKCMGGEILTRMAPVDSKEEKQIVKEMGDGVLKKIYTADDLARGDKVVFVATGITDGNILRGVHVDGQSASTSSIVMRSRYRTVRKVKATHDLSHKTIRLRSAEAEARL